MKIRKFVRLISDLTELSYFFHTGLSIVKEDINEYSSYLKYTF